jgi:hypothetical protein
LARILRCFLSQFHPQLHISFLQHPSLSSALTNLIFFPPYIFLATLTTYDDANTTFQSSTTPINLKQGFETLVLAPLILALPFDHFCMIEKSK